MSNKLDQEDRNLEIESLIRNLEIESLITAYKRGLMSRLQLRKYLKEMGEIKE